MTIFETFTPVVLNQLFFTVFLIVALAVGVNLYNTLKKIRGRHRRLRFAPRYALAYVGKLAQSS